MTALNATSLKPAAQQAMSYLIREMSGPGALLLPLRLFLAVGWLRAMIEKAIIPGWWDGQALTVWLLAHLCNSPRFPGNAL
ncbi:hypothetical protein [Deinococcus arenicola]|uniref:Uncharacterized protein n=1 Tax=Deinococcus arenicola TaxID=2994950 RepID=A0ABU4DVX1_9DEIO|nr:hypothetical protein [Deinococcus sp. ZS9-10]MDV6376608.1 hypothetical protein [Deinococcus sp. ZS9-10]